MVDVARLEMQVDSRQVKTATKDIEGLGKQSGLATKAVKLFGAAFATIGVGNTLLKIANDTRQFSTAISQLSAITGATGRDLEFFREQSMLIGKTTTLSASQAATAFQLIASAKPDLLSSRDALAAVTKEAVTLAEAASIDLTQAAQTVGVALNQFGAEADQANRFVNVLAAGSKFGSSLITQTAEALKNAGSAAALAGLSFEEANVGIQLLAKGGLFAAEAGTGFRQVLMKLESEASRKFKPSVVGLAAALENLAAENMSLTEIMDMFGAEAAKSAATMIAQAGSARTLERQLTGTQTAAEQAATNFANMEGDLQSLDSAVQGLAISLGTRAEPLMRKTIQTVKNFALAAENFVRSEKFTRFLEIAIKGLQLLSIILGVKIVGALSASIVAFAKATTAVGLFGKALALAGGPITVTITGLYALYEILNRVVGTDTSRLQRELQEAANLGMAPLTEHVEKLREEQERLEQQVENLSDPLKQSSIEVNALQRAKAQLAAVTNSLGEAEHMLESRLASAASQADATGMDISELESEFAALTGTLNNEFDPSVENITLSLEELNEQSEYSVEVTKEMNSNYAKVRDALSSKMTQLNMTAREQFLYNEQLKLGKDATLDARLEIEKLAGEYFDAEEANKANTTATKESIDALEFQKNAVENVQRSFGQLIYDTLSDGKLNFKSFFNSVLDGFKKLVAELAAQKLTEAIFGSGGLSGFLSSLSGGFSSIIGAIGSGISNVVGSIASGGASGAVTSGASSAITGGATGATGGFMAGAKGTLAATGAKVASGLKTAGAAISGGAKATLAALSNPVTAAVLAAAAAAKLLDSGGTPTSAFGITMAETAGMKGKGNVFAMDPFSSGFAPLGFKQNATNAQAIEAALPFRQLDASLTNLARDAGYKVDLSNHTFSGYGVEGTGAGTLLGTFIEEGKVKGTSLAEQMGRYASEWVYAVGARNSVPVNELQPIVGDGSAEGILARVAQRYEEIKLEQLASSQRMGLNSVPVDGMFAMLHRGERVMTAGKADMTDQLAEEMKIMRSDFNELMFTVAKATTRTARIEDRWDKNGLPPVRT